MTTTLEYNSKLHIIEIVHAGRTTEANLTAVTTKGIELTKEKNIFDVLIDVTEIELAASLFDIFNLPAKQYAEKALDHRIRIGLVQPKLSKEKENAQFYETACVNRGWLVKTFSNRNDAIDWLKNRDSSNKRMQPDPAKLVR